MTEEEARAIAKAFMDSNSAEIRRDVVARIRALFGEPSSDAPHAFWLGEEGCI